MHNKQQINFILRIFFLFVTLFYLVKQESKTNNRADYSFYSEKTYSGFVIDSNHNPTLPIYTYYFSGIYQNITNPINDISYALNQSTLKVSLHYLFVYCHDLSPVFLPKTQIIRILHKKNICHKSSDDKPASFVFC